MLGRHRDEAAEQHYGNGSLHVGSLMSDNDGDAESHSICGNAVELDVVTQHVLQARGISDPAFRSHEFMS